MSEREMLERAAAAAGLYYWIDGDALLTHGDGPGTSREWNPLTDDGDCARLEAVLLLHVEWMPAIEKVWVGTAEFGCTRPWGNDRQAARRYAATRAAAALAPTAQGE